MSESAKLRTSAVLKSLRDALPVFSGQSQEIYHAVYQEVRKTLDDLREREQFWNIEHERRQRAFQEIDLQVKRCHAVAAAARNQTGPYINLCAPLENRRFEALRYLERARVGLRDTRRFITFVQTAEKEFRTQEYRLRQWFDQQMPRAQHELQRLAFLADTYSSGTDINSTSAATVISPSQTEHSTPIQIFSKDGLAIQMVPLGLIDWQADHVRGPTDFQHGATLDEIVDGWRKFEETVRPNVEMGKSRDYFITLDEQLGLQGNARYTKVYDSFYGEGPSGYIKLTRQGDRYTVDRGHHRLYAANHAGIAAVPAVVVDITASNFPAEYREGNLGGPERSA